MRRKIAFVAVAAIGVAMVLGSALAQGRGYGRGQGRGMGAGYCRGAGLGRGSGPGAAGGWWNRVAPRTAEEKAFVQRVGDLHAQIRASNVRLAGLYAKEAPADKIQAEERRLVALRDELRKITAANQALMERMGVPPGAGVCNGLGPGAGGGPRRDGSGPNPNCPLKR